MIDDKSPGAGASLPPQTQDARPQSPSTSSTGGQGKDRRSVEGDARGQFVQSQHGKENNGVSSASPRVTTGTDDATFENDPGD
ncbi:MAG TPA: hypothetical protein VGN98_15275 [Tianweitania sediminis]|jgi:hypothetical protein|nr:hypothetical protein [Tianweitania sediminis]